MVLVEKFVAGRELTCAVIGGKALDVIEIQAADGGWYDYHAKYAKGGSIHVLPAKLKGNIYQYVQDLALRAHQALGCRGVSRADFRYDDRPGGTGELVVLEVNTQPGMTETSLVPELAAHIGLTFGELVRWMVDDASCDR
jgi:D-alanine-D-alanine ligase